MDFSNYTVEDFVLNDYFQRWSKGQLPSEDHFWETWLAAHPEKRDEVIKAKILVQALEIKPVEQDPAETSRRIDGVIRAVKWRAALGTYGWKAAAAIVLAGTFTYFILTQKEGIQDTVTPVIAVTDSRLIEKTNEINHPVEIVLPDGSKVRLSPAARITYPEKFDPQKREISLEGEGFFEIRRQTRQPFFVYTQDLTTKVLGTSFTIQARPDAASTTVKVISGKVSVTPAVQDDRHATPQQPGVILTPNQMALFERKPKKLVKTIVESPRLLPATTIQPRAFHFINTPVAEVFSNLEAAYGIPITWDPESLKNCTVTAPLENETLYQKLDLICKVLEASYEVLDGQIVINNNQGCR